jgi:hypothetical protein
MQKLIILSSFLLFLIPGNIIAEGIIEPKAVSDKRKIQIGEPFHVSVFVDYPSENQLLFPDSTFAFGNCILKDRRFFPTQTRNEISRDCVVYQLACFNPSPIQSFSIPVIRFENGDSIRFNSNEIMFQILPELDSSSLKKADFLKDVNPAIIPLQINYPYAIGIMAVVVLLLLLANIFLDKPIQRFFYLWLERRRQKRYLKAFNRIQDSLKKEATIQGMESLMVLWKKYLQRLNGKPFLSYTSLEITKELPDPLLKKTLQETDRWIYGGMTVENLEANIEKLKEKSLQLYEQKRENIRNGKLGKKV